MALVDLVVHDQIAGFKSSAKLARAQSGAVKLDGEGRHEPNEPITAARCGAPRGCALQIVARRGFASASGPGLSASPRSEAGSPEAGSRLAASHGPQPQSPQAWRRLDADLQSRHAWIRRHVHRRPSAPHPTGYQWGVSGPDHGVDLGEIQETLEQVAIEALDARMRASRSMMRSAISIPRLVEFHAAMRDALLVEIPTRAPLGLPRLVARRSSARCPSEAPQG